jgi:predicted transcriptional regulator of viral defense system
MSMIPANTGKIVELVRRFGVLRPRDLDKYDIPRRYMSRLYQKGMLERVGRGLYSIPGAESTEHHTVALVSKQIPRAIVCLLSALQFHNLTSQNPYQVWIAINRTARRPRAPELPIRIVRFSGVALTEGIEDHMLEGVTVRVYGIAKTVADCFKYRNKIGLDVALESLRECLRERRCTSDELWHYAKICRVANVMRPYLEAIS